MKVFAAAATVAALVAATALSSCGPDMSVSPSPPSSPTDAAGPLPTGHVVFTGAITGEWIESGDDLHPADQLQLCLPTAVSIHIKGPTPGDFGNVLMGEGGELSIDIEKYGDFAGSGGTFTPSVGMVADIDLSGPPGKPLHIRANLQCGLASLTGQPSPSQTATASHAGSTGFQALDGRQLPGTPVHASPSGWSSLAALPSRPTPSIGAETASSDDYTYLLALFDFASPAEASAFFSTPPVIAGFTGSGMSYAPLAGVTGIAAPSRAVDFRSCPNFSRPCPDTVSVAVGTIIQRGNTVIFVAYVPGRIVVEGDASDLTKLTPYAQRALQLLASAGLGS